MTHLNLIDCLKTLIAIPSITPEDKGAQSLLADWLTELGFKCEDIPYPPVSNLWARIGTEAPLVVFAGHTDVVPPGNLDEWHTPPFEAHINQDQVMTGRGSADMKGSIAAMLIACQQFLSQRPAFKGSIGFLITSGEEGDDYDLGTPKVMEYLKKNHISIDNCIVGEPSSTEHVGDVIKVGRRGSLTGQLTIQGHQGHVAYPHLAINPIHQALTALSELIHHEFCQGNDFFPKTSLQFTSIQSGGEAGNVIPGELHCQFNLRYSSELTAEDIQSFVESLLERHQLNYQLNWQHNGKPFLTQGGRLIEIAKQSIMSVTGKDPELSTSGGTSDGRFIAPFCKEVIELGPCNASIHKVNEHVCLKQLELLSEIYQKILSGLLK